MMAGMITLILIGLLRGIRTHRALVLENLALRHQLAVLQRSAPRLRLRRSDRLFWVLLSRLWSGWPDGVSIVQPATVIRWQRSGFKLFWTWKSSRNGPGRPAVAPEIRALIRRMSKANPLWGAPRIPGELQKLGVEISQAAVSKYVVRRRRPPSQTWRTFLDNHLGASSPSTSSSCRRRCSRSCSSSSFWRTTADALSTSTSLTPPPPSGPLSNLWKPSPRDTAPRYLLRDRDGVYGVEFWRRVKGMGIGEVMTAPRSPWQNPYVERIIGTLPPRVPRPRRGAERNPSAPPAERVPHLLPRGPHTPLPGEGRPGATTGGAP